MQVSGSPFIELDIEAPIREELGDLVIVEYPVIHVFLPSHRCDFEVIKAPSRPKIDLNEPITDVEDCSNGVSFRVEEIQEDDHLEAQVLDLMKHAEPDKAFQNICKSKDTEKDTLDSTSAARITEVPVVKNILCVDMAEDKKLLLSDQSGEDMTFDFEQELLNSCSDVQSKTNLDDVFEFVEDV